jgi:hypothetical protein
VSRVRGIWGGDNCPSGHCQGSEGDTHGDEGDLHGDEEVEGGL